MTARQWFVAALLTAGVALTACAPPGSTGTSSSDVSSVAESTAPTQDTAGNGACAAPPVEREGDPIDIAGVLRKCGFKTVTVIKPDAAFWLWPFGGGTRTCTFHLSKAGAEGDWIEGLSTVVAIKVTPTDDTGMMMPERAGEPIEMKLEDVTPAVLAMLPGATSENCGNATLTE